MKERVKDLLLGSGLLAVGFVALLAIRAPQEQTRISSGAELTYATLPTIYAWILIALVSLYMGKTAFALWKSRPRDGQPADQDRAKASTPEAVFSSQRTVILRTAATLLILLVYVLLLESVHFFILTVLFLAVLFFVYGQRSIPKIAAVSLVGGAVFYFLFIYLLKLPV